MFSQSGHSATGVNLYLKVKHTLYSHVEKASRIFYLSQIDNKSQ